MHATHDIRTPAVAGMFYPREPHRLRRAVNEFLQKPGIATHAPNALIVPHAGFAYSGPVAGTAYAQLKSFAPQYRRVVLLGPSHHVSFEGLATSSASEFETPLGDMPLDRSACGTVARLPQVSELDVAHAREHSLEVQIPFLQVVLPHCQLVPLVVGQAPASDVAEVVNALWTPDTLIVASSDLSHYHDYETACGLDAATVKLIEGQRFEQLSGDRACGFMAVRGLLAAARGRGLYVSAVDVRNSGDTAGSRDQVVGYAAFVVSKEPIQHLAY